MMPNFGSSMSSGESHRFSGRNNDVTSPPNTLIWLFAKTETDALTEPPVSFKSPPKRCKGTIGAVHRAVVVH